MATYTHDTAPTRHVEAANGVSYGYRRFGVEQGTPVLFFQHFIGNLDDFDPAVTDGLASDREVILYNYAGVGSSTGQTAETIEQTARDAAAFIEALGLTSVDLLAHSMGGLAAQQLAFDRPDLVRKIILVGTQPRGGDGLDDLPEETIALFSKKYERQEEMWLPILFAPSETSQAAGRAFLKRIMTRKDRDTPVKPEVAAAQSAALTAYAAQKDPGYAHLKNLEKPVLVVNGNNDTIVPTKYSYIIQQHAPNATLILYPDSNHAAHFQYHKEFVAHARLFLDAA
ncbi:alpha/beta hydrolase [Streptomyces sp. NPDC093228]|uniref:alpha/beta fold hydrolase n=1 Tax=Streptomyces sp. NPDC093228 TaxID=3155070 RepID=UPI00341945AA